MDTAAGALQALFPELRVPPLLTVARGFGSAAFETADGVIFRIARWKGSADGHIREWNVLRALRGRLPAPIPYPEWRIEPGNPAFPLGGIGYRKLRGETLSPGRSVGPLADSLASFFAALHGLETGGLDVEPWLPAGEAFAWQRDQVLPPLRDALSAGEYRRVERWWAELLADERMTRFRPVLRHGDPWYGNVLVEAESGALAGVLDWEGIELGDPAWDLAAQLYLGERFFMDVRERYARRGRVADADLVYRARKLFEVREFGGVRLAVALGDNAELADAVAKLRAGPVLAP